MILDRPILIAGFGSIGRRHLLNLQALGYKNLVLYRTGKSTLTNQETNSITVEHNLGKALSYKPFATIISNPTALHIPLALVAAKSESHLFIEKPISHNLERVKELRKIVQKNNLIVQVGFQFRFHQELVKIKRRLDKNEIGKIVSVQVHWGEYLPNWHPWENYKKSYAARKDLGGGALLTLCHPFDYLSYLFGKVDSVFCEQRSIGGLKIDVEDTADILLNFKSGIIGNVHLDYIQKPPEHYIRIIGQNGIIHLNFLKNNYERNEMFISEMKHFLSCIKDKKQPLCTLNDGISALQIVLAAKESVKRKKIIEIKNEYYR